MITMPDEATTGERFQQFCDESRYWLTYFGLLDWEVFFRSAPVDGGYASYKADLAGRVATLTLNPEPETEIPVTHRDTLRSAFHEVAHLLISGLEYYTERMLMDHGSVEEIAHCVVRRLENSLFEEHYRRRFET